jgi:hypothetical protein
MSSAPAVIETFYLTVPSGSNLQSLLARAAFDYVNSDVVTRFSSEVGSVDGEYGIFKFTHAATTAHVEMVMAEAAFVPATLVGLICFAIEMPKFQQNIPVIALGSTWNHTVRDSMVPAIWGGDRSRELNICSRGTRWFAGDGFLARRN